MKTELFLSEYLSVIVCVFLKWKHRKVNSKYEESAYRESNKTGSQRRWGVKTKKADTMPALEKGRSLRTIRIQGLLSQALIFYFPLIVERSL